MTVANNLDQYGIDTLQAYMISIAGGYYLQRYGNTVDFCDMFGDTIAVATRQGNSTMITVSSDAAPLISFEAELLPDAVSQKILQEMIQHSKIILKDPGISPVIVVDTQDKSNHFEIATFGRFLPWTTLKNSCENQVHPTTAFYQQLQKASGLTL